MSEEKLRLRYYCRYYGKEARGSRFWPQAAVLFILAKFSKSMKHEKSEQINVNSQVVFEPHKSVKISG